MILMATSGKQLSSLPSASSIAGNNEFLTWVGNDTAQKVSRDDFIKSLPTYRQPNTAYAVGNITYHSALPTGYYLECTTGGTTSVGNITPTRTIGGTVSDGTVTWKVSRDLPLIGGGALTGTSLKWNANDLGGSAIVAKSLGANGYIKYASGLIIQWGGISINGEGVLTLNVNFSNSLWTIVMQANNGPGDFTQYSISEKNINKCKVTANNTGARGMMWVAIGY
jgi:hypothetical protein